MFKFLFIFLLIITNISCTQITDNKKIEVENNAEALLRKNKPKLAIKELSKMPNSIKKFNLLAISYSKMKNYDKAELNYQKALKIDSKDIKTILNYAILKAKQEKYSEALNMIKNLQKIDTNIEINITLAQLYVLINSKDRAIEETKKIDKSKLTLKQIERLISLYGHINSDGLAAEMYEYYISKAVDENVNIDFIKIKQIINKLRI
jgi:Flp pilus assembly protein TadD